MAFDTTPQQPSRDRLELPQVSVTVVGDTVHLDAYGTPSRLDENDALRLAGFLARFHREQSETATRNEQRSYARAARQGGGGR